MCYFFGMHCVFFGGGEGFVCLSLQFLQVKFVEPGLVTVATPKVEREVEKVR